MQALRLFDAVGAGFGLKRLQDQLEDGAACPSNVFPDRRGKGFKPGFKKASSLFPKERGGLGQKHAKFLLPDMKRVQESTWQSASERDGLHFSPTQLDTADSVLFVLFFAVDVQHADRAGDEHAGRRGDLSSHRAGAAEGGR